MRVHIVRIEWCSGITDVAAFHCAMGAANYVIGQATQFGDCEATTLDEVLEEMGSSDNYVYIDELEVQ